MIPNRGPAIGSGIGLELHHRILDSLGGRG